MTKTVTQIDCPEEWQSTNDWDSHRPLLWLSLNNTPGLVIETGCGDGSTILLKEYCSKNKRQFASFETNASWAKKYNKITWWVEDYFKGISEYADRHEIDSISLMFIDAAPAEVRKDILRLWASSLVSVIHDTEPGADYVYHMAEILSTFKYRLDYQPEGKPHTTAVSNIIDLTQWC